MSTEIVQANRRSPALPPVPLIISRLPHRLPPSQQGLGALVTIELANIWRELLSPEERGHMDRWLEGSQEKVPAAVFSKLDLLILKQAETLGSRLETSELVHLRLSEWERMPHGPELHERLGRAKAKAVRRFQAKELVPIDDPDLRRAKAETVEELRLLLRPLRAVVSTSRVAPAKTDVLNHFRSTIENEREAFPYLASNRESWLRFIQTHPTVIRDLLLGTRAKPAMLFDEWMGWSKGRDADSIRQMLSRMAKS